VPPIVDMQRLRAQLQPFEEISRNPIIRHTDAAL